MEGGGAPGGWELGGNAAAAGDESIAVASYLDFLTDDLLGPGGIGGALPQMPAGQLMDSSTLAAVVAAGAIEGQGQRQPRKRVRREPSGHLEAAAADNGSNDDDFDPSDDDDELLSGGSGRKGGGSKRKGPAAAQNKASREKARREKINDRFGELAKLVDPSNEPKTDKLSILSESIRYVQQTQLENSQLRQLNKFLEEKVGQLEKERGQYMYQMYQFSAMQPAAAAAGGAGPSGAAAAATAVGMMAPPNTMMLPGGMAAGPGMPLQALGMQPLMQQQPQPQALASCSGTMLQQQPQQQLMMGAGSVLQQQPSMQGAAGPSSVNLQQQPQQQQVMCYEQQPQQQQPQQPQEGAQQPQQQQQVDPGQMQQQQPQQQQPNQQQQQQQMQGPPGMPGMLMPPGATAAAAAAQQGGLVPQHMACKPMLGAPPMPQGMMVPYWPSMMPQSMLDSTQDSLLRPPAA